MVKHLLRNVAAALMIMAAGLLGTQNLFAQNHAIRGSVIDAAGQPVIGAAVVVVGNKTLGVVTAADGSFTMSVPAGANLSVSCIGYKTQVLTAGNQTVFRIVLEEDTQLLEETVVIGYGVQKKSDLTGSVASVRSTDLVNRSTTDAAAALQGKAAGVQILNYSGAPGQGAAIRVRGYSSNSGSIGPLLIVDGLQVSSIQYLDPNMIESMEVLKDAASAAIYGAEAGNGVVLITTKSGNKGVATVTYETKMTRQSLGKVPSLLNAADFITYKKMAGYDMDARLAANNYDGTDTNWLDAYMAPSWSQQHSLSFSGGNDKGHFFTSLNYVNDDGIVKGDKDVYKRLTAQLNADYNLFKWLQVGTNTSLEKWSTQSVGGAGYGSSFESVLVLDPLTPVYWSDPSQFTTQYKEKYDAVQAGTSEVPYRFLKDTNGKWYATSPYEEVVGGNPLLLRDVTDSQNNGINVNGTLFANIMPFKGLTFTSRFGYRLSMSSSHSYSAPYYINSKNDQKSYSISASANTSYYYQWENFATYNTRIAGKHDITLMAGMSYRENNSDGVNASASGPDILKSYEPNFLYLNYVNSAKETSKSFGNAPSRSASLAYFGRAIYSYDNRYSIQANFRADAFDSSKLSKAARWGYFPSFSAGWTVSNESFMKDNVSRDILSFLKLRASWGRNGNINVLGGYSYSTTIATNSQWYQYSVTDGAQTLGSAPNGLANPNLKWETSDQLDFGLDSRLLSDRLSFGVDYYVKDTKDLLVSISPVPEIGVSSTTVNAGSVRNSGLEFEASWKDHIGDFNYSVSGNLSTLKNRVTYLHPSIHRIISTDVSSTNLPVQTAFEVGYPIWYMRGYIYDGVNEDGSANLRDVNGDGKISTDDMTYIGKGIPDVTYGLTINLAYKGFDFALFGSGVAGNNIFYSLYRTGLHNLSSYFFKNSWSETNKGAKLPDPAKVEGNLPYWGSTASLFKGDFFKIKQIQLGYTLPSSLTKKVAISNMRLYVSLDDFFTITKYPGMDPETATLSSASGMGFDWGSYPTMRKLILGVNVTF